MFNVYSAHRRYVLAYALSQLWCGCSHAWRPDLSRRRALGPDGAESLASTAAGMIRWHNRPDWAPPMFKEPIQGVKVAGHCTFPSYNAVYGKHDGLGLVATIGESNRATCAGVMSFGDWAKNLEKAEKATEAAGGKADTLAATIRPR